jgi:hypothetical protein
MVKGACYALLVGICLVSSLADISPLVCDTSTFPTNFTGQEIEGLKQATATTIDKCPQACCDAGADCHVWQWSIDSGCWIGKYEAARGHKPGEFISFGRNIPPTPTPAAPTPAPPTPVPVLEPCWTENNFDYNGNDILPGGACVNTVSDCCDLCRKYAPNGCRFFSCDDTGGGCTGTGTGPNTCYLKSANTGRRPATDRTSGRIGPGPAATLLAVPLDPTDPTQTGWTMESGAIKTGDSCVQLDAPGKHFEFAVCNATAPAQRFVFEHGTSGNLHPANDLAACIAAEHMVGPQVVPYRCNTGSNEEWALSDNAICTPPSATQRCLAKRSTKPTPAPPIVCDATTFPVNLTGLQVEGLSEVTKISDVDDCRHACCEAGPDCYLWQWERASLNVRATPAPTPLYLPAITGVKWAITWGSAGSHNGVSHAALAAGNSQQVWTGRGAGYSATLTCSRRATGELSAHYSDTHKDTHDANPVAKGCSKFALNSGHTVQCCFPCTGCCIGKWASSTPNAGIVSFGRNVPVPTPPPPKVWPCCPPPAFCGDALARGPTQPTPQPPSPLQHPFDHHVVRFESNASGQFLDFADGQFPTDNPWGSRRRALQWARVSENETEALPIWLQAVPAKAHTYTARVRWVEGNEPVAGWLIADHDHVCRGMPCVRTSRRHFNWSSFPSTPPQMAMLLLQMALEKSTLKGVPVAQWQSN